MIFFFFFWIFEIYIWGIYHKILFLLYPPPYQPDSEMIFLLKWFWENWCRTSFKMALETLHFNRNKSNSQFFKKNKKNVSQVLTHSTRSIAKLENEFRSMEALKQNNNGLRFEKLKTKLVKLHIENISILCVNTCIYTY